MKRIKWNRLSRKCYKVIKKRIDNGADLSFETLKQLKHLATEVIELVDVCRELEDSWPPQEVMPLVGHEISDVLICTLVLSYHLDCNLDRFFYETLKLNKRRAKGLADKK